VPTLPARAWARWLRSFRGRVTATLFIFFLAPTVLFGLVAYRALAGVVVRAARTIAERAVSQAVDQYHPPEVTLRDLALDAGTDVLRYYYGELAETSSPEALELGVYGAWMRPSVFRTLQGGEEAAAQDTIRIGAHSYLVAYQNLTAFGTVAVPMPLSAGDVAIRQRELADLILLTALIGGIMSLALSVLVGRTLAGPIGRLRRAAAAVGSGQLRVHLPESQGDEFGDLFASFNRMVKRLRRARAQEVRAARVLAWGEMAQQVAHEIKNPLTPIKLAVQHIRRAYRDGRGDFPVILEDNVEQILIEIDRLSEIARAFSRYGAPGDGAGPLEDVDVGAVIHEALMLYRTGDANVDYREEVAEDLPQVRARPGEFKEVVLNLVENARNALDGRDGRIVIAAEYDGEWIEAKVADDGPGIPAELLPRVFEPHFSTRSTGTGLGLAIVRRLVESWGGAVSAESEAGRGTVIRIRLVPAAAPQRTL
jgi:signal transduction histidine kinase